MRSDQWRAPFAGCDCSLGLDVCSCTTACEKTEHATDDLKNYPFDEVARAALQGQQGEKR